MDKERTQAEAALNFLSTTDQEIVALERNYKDAEQVYKETKAAIIKCTDGAMDLRKAEAVKNTIEGPVSESTPASVLRRHPNATLFLDSHSASLLSLQN